MSNVVTINADYIMSRLNTLPPSSRRRAGYVDLLRHIKRAQIEADVARMREADGFTAMLADALEMELAEAF